MAVSEWFVPPAQTDIVLDELPVNCFSSWSTVSAALAHAGSNVTQDSAKHSAGTSSNLGGGAGSANVQQMVIRTALAAGALHPVVPPTPAGATLELEYPTGVLYALYLRVDLRSSSHGAPSTGGVVLQMPRTMFQVGSSYAARFLTTADLAAGVVKADIPAAATGPVSGGYTGALLGQYVPATINSDGSLEYWWAVVSDVNRAAADIPNGSAESVWVISPTPVFPDNYPVSIRYSYQPPRYRWVTEDAAVPTALMEGAGEAGSATSVRVTALPAAPGSPSARAAAREALRAVQGPRGDPAGGGPDLPAAGRVRPGAVDRGRRPGRAGPGARDQRPHLGVRQLLRHHRGRRGRAERDPGRHPALGRRPGHLQHLHRAVDPGGRRHRDQVQGPRRRQPVHRPRLRVRVPDRGGAAQRDGLRRRRLVHRHRQDVRRRRVGHLDGVRAARQPGLDPGHHPEQSFQDDPSDPDNFQHDTGLQDLCLDITGDKLMVRTGGRQTFDTLRTISDRPIIVVISGKARRTRLLVVDRKYASHDFRHSDVGPTDMRFLLGRPNVEITRVRGTARMDLMEFATFNRDLGPKEMWQVASKLDSVYGVSR